MERRGASAGLPGETVARDAAPDEPEFPADGGSRAVDRDRELHDLQVLTTQLQADYEQARWLNRSLEQARSALAELYDFAPIVYLSLDPDCRIRAANLTAATLLGRARGSLLGKSLTSLVVPDQRAPLLAHVRRCLREQIRVDDEMSFAVLGRPAVAAQITSAPIIDSDGRAVGCKTVIVDISALKWAQQKLQFLTRASGCLGSLDIEASLAEISRLAVPVFADVALVDLALASGELRRLETAFADEDLAKKLRGTRAREPRIHEGTVLGRVLRARTPMRFNDCTPASITAVGGPEHDSLIKAIGPSSIMYVPILVRGEVSGVFTFAATVSGRQFSPADLATAVDLAARAGMAMENAQLFEQAQRAIAARQDVLSFVSHDLRNPLMGITLTVENMLRAAPGPERRRSAGQLARIRRAAQQMRRMIEDLLDMSAIEGGRLNIQLGAHEAGALLEELSETFGGTAAAGGIALEIAPPPIPIVVSCDRQRLLQVLSNLVDNALKFTPEGGRITVSVRADSATALFIVKDTGSGIPTSVRPHVFEQFRQARETARQGRGLGLFITKGLVEAQGGAIWVDSEEGVGTTFSFTLPLAPAGATGSFRRGRDDAAGPKRR